MARNSALRKEGRAERDPVSWDHENEFFDPVVWEDLEDDENERFEEAGPPKKAKFEFQEGGRHDSPRDRVRTNKWLADMVAKAEKERDEGCPDYTPPRPWPRR